MTRDKPQTAQSPHHLPSILALLAAIAILLPACSSVTKAWPDNPLNLNAPYSATPTWAVAPLTNESGVSTIDELRISDRLVEEIRQAKGVSAVPLNRTIAAMRTLGLPAINTREDAAELANHMGVNAVLVGSITAWNPYEPPELGISLALFQSRTNPTTGDPWANHINPATLTRIVRGSDDQPHYELQTATPGARTAVALHLSGSNGHIRNRVKDYATGRADPNSATGWKGYLTAMNRFERYAAFESISQLLAAEADYLKLSQHAVEQPTTHSPATWLAQALDRLPTL